MATKKKGLKLDVYLESHGDVRFVVLGNIAEYNEFEAHGRMHRLWAWCLLQDTQCVHEEVVRQFLGPKGVEAILGNGVDTLALGERQEDGSIYVRGAEDNLTWLARKRAAAKKGGDANAAARRRGDGTFGPADHQPPASQTTSHQPARPPATVQPSASATTLSGPFSDMSDPLPPEPDARARSMGTVPTTVPVPVPAPAVMVFPGGVLTTVPIAGQDQHRLVAQEAWRYGAERHAVCQADGIGADAQPWRGIAMGNDEVAVYRRIGELRKGYTFDEALAEAKRVVDVFEAEARSLGHLRWFVPHGVWGEKTFWTAAGKSVEQASKSAEAKPRSGSSIGPAEPRSDHPDGTYLNFGDAT